MDIYTTSFTYPAPPISSVQHTQSPEISLSTPAQTVGSTPGSGPSVSGSGPTSATTSATVSTAPATGTAPLTGINLSPLVLAKTARSITTHDQIEKDWQAVQKLVLEITSREGCLVTVTRERIGEDVGSCPAEHSQSENDDLSIPTTIVWNFHITGAYQPVMAAKGHILRETPRSNSFTLKTSRSDVLESPFAIISPLKADVARKLEEIVSESEAEIKVIIPDDSSPVGGIVIAMADEKGLKSHQQLKTPLEQLAFEGRKDFAHAERTGGTLDEGSRKKSFSGAVGLETERTCELIISGSTESVELAKLKILVMFDDLNGLHAESCDIDYKLHNIIAGRKRCLIQQIQEETATTIYYPTALVGVLNAPQPGSQQGVGYRYSQMSMGGMSPMQLQPAGPIGIQIANTMPHGPATGMGLNGMGSVHMGMPGMNINFPHHYQHNPHGRNPPPIYNPHQHIHYPYQPQPVNMDLSATRGMSYNGPGMHYPINHGPPPPMSDNHNHAVGSSMHTDFSNGPSRIGSPIPPPAHHPSMGMSHHQAGPSHHHPPQFPHAQSHYHSMPNPMSHNVSMGMPHMNMSLDPAARFGGHHPGLSIHGGEQGRLGKSNEIWITGEFFGVQRARDMLLNVAMQKCKLVISRDTPILPRKLDWLLTEKIDEIRTIMNDNGTYIQVPSVGSQASLITVFGDHRVNIERTIRSVMALACQFYVASLWLLPMTVDVIMPQSSLNPAQMQPILKKVAHTSGAEVVFKSNCFEMYGLEKQVRAAVMMALELELVQDFRREIRLQIELANEHRDFISGKKNGKINKIMKMANVKIKFETFNDYNFLIDIAGDDRDALQGLMMLQEELPAEMSFHVPESYHKRIIGVSGRNIQKIMKLHGVYVKFSNAEEFAALGGYGDNEDNVVARTPAKNAANLDNLKQAVMEMVSPKDKDYTFESVAIPRKYHRTLLGEKSIFIHDIEQKTNSVVRFPYKETGSEIVTVFGPESQVHIATAMLLNHVPFEADLHIPFNPELPRLVASNDFVIFSERVKHDHQIAIHPPIRLSPGTEAIFKFRCQRSNVHCLDTAREALEEWLGQQNISVYPKNSSRRGDSFKNAFSHFNSKLLATGGNVDATEEGEVFANGMPRGHGENVRALFNGSGTVHVDPLSHRDPMREVWHGSNQQPPAPTRTESDHQKRDSDPIINDRLRQAIAGHGNPFSHRHPHSQPRISSNRHQSLDISQLNFSRALSSGSSVFGPMPPSPTAVNSSPNTATGPNFPHMGSHSIRTNLTGRGSYGGGSSGDLESVTQTMSNMQVSHQ
ncbi:uncharacterized protein L203_104917 [Cryptococcus depauperatus CBS 7841]|uniref:K Homology domain-containing protein n=1 Tax=Cryptococcus depauperatus CBS 7841 TaxID=1295531 RepID=A0AAJ8M3G3_9TREE